MKIFIHNNALNFLSNDDDEPIIFPWPSLLKYLELGDILKNFRSFDETSLLFKTYIEKLSTSSDQELIFYLFDHLFSDCLTHTKALPELNSSFLLERIQQKKNSLEHKKILSKELDRYVNLFIHHKNSTLHNLTLYLGWDRMCASLKNLFDYQSSNEHFQKGISLLKGCLIESFQHIHQDKKTTPSFYKLMEALIFYYLREENVNTHTNLEWSLFTQAIPLLSQSNQLKEYYYIDEAIFHEDLQQSADPILVYTRDPQEQIQIRVSLAKMIFEKLKFESDWHYTLSDVQIK